MAPVSTVVTSLSYPVLQIKKMHRLAEIDEHARTGVCCICGHTRIKIRDKNASTANGRWRCIAVYKKNFKKSQYPYVIHKKDICEHCGFVPDHSSQLEVDHIDGNHYNNEPGNLQTLCANCHRLKTHINRDWEKQKEAPTQDFS